MAINIGRRVLFATLIGLVSAACERSSRLTSPSPADPIPGTYGVTVSAGSECSAIPAPARTRTYSAKIDPDVRFGYLITLSDATFATDVQLSERSIRVECGGPVFGSGLGCNQFVAGRDGDDIEFQLIHNSERMNNEFGGAGGTIVELIDPHTRLDIGGRGRGRFDGRTIQARLGGFLFYCSPLRNDGISCASHSVRCDTSDLSLAFTRK